MIDDYCLECHADVHTALVAQRRTGSARSTTRPTCSRVRETRKVAARARRQRAGARAAAPAATIRCRSFSGALRRSGVRRRERPDRRRPASPAPSATRSPTSTARAATPTTRSRSRCTTRSPSATTRCCSGSTGSWSRPSPSSTSRRSSSRCTRPPSSAPPATRCTCRSELNHYKWLRGQNHYDTFLLSRRLRPRRRSLLLPAEGRGQLQRLPHAAAGLDRLRRQVTSTASGELQGPRPHVPRGQHGHPAPARSMPA